MLIQSFDQNWQQIIMIKPGTVADKLLTAVRSPHPAQARGREGRELDQDAACRVTLLRWWLVAGSSVGRR